MIENIDKIHTFAERLLLAENANLLQTNYLNELEYALDHVHGILSSKDEYIEVYKHELRLRLAMHFSPTEAINFDPESDFTREELIEAHLVKCFGKTDEHARVLAKTITDILDRLNVGRASIAKYRDSLLEKQNYKCNHCHVKFEKDGSTYKANTVFKDDKFKPYRYQKKDLTDFMEFKAAEVDHVKPVSILGSNDEDNLQVLCRLCNLAKSNILSVKTLDEIKYAGHEIEDILKEKPSHIHKMFYFTVLRAAKKCEICGKSGRELTARKIIENGPFTRSNLKSVCLYCLKKEKR